MHYFLRWLYTGKKYLSKNNFCGTAFEVISTIHNILNAYRCLIVYKALSVKMTKTLRVILMNLREKNKPLESDDNVLSNKENQHPAAVMLLPVLSSMRVMYFTQSLECGELLR